MSTANSDVGHPDNWPNKFTTYKDDESIFIYQQAAVATPDAVRDGEWTDNGPLMGWVPTLGTMKVSCPTSKRRIFVNRDHAIYAAYDFQAKCIEKLIEADEELPDGWVWAHRNIGDANDHLLTSKCWCSPEKIGPDDELKDGQFIV